MGGRRNERQASARPQKEDFHHSEVKHTRATRRNGAGDGKCHSRVALLVFPGSDSDRKFIKGGSYRLHANHLRNASFHSAAQHLERASRKSH